MKPERELADIARAAVLIEYLLQLGLLVTTQRIYELSIVKFKANVFERYSVIDRWYIKPNAPVDRFPHRCCKNFAVWDVVTTVGFVRTYAFDREADVCAVRADDANVVSILEQLNQRVHCRAHVLIISKTQIKVEILEVLGAQAGALSHGRRRPAQGHPLHVVVSMFEMDGLNIMLEYISELFTGQSGILLRIQRCSNANERISLFQYVEFGIRHEANVLGVVRKSQLAYDLIVFGGDQRCGANCTSFPN